jgi:hypothetical protein
MMIGSANAVTRNQAAGAMATLSGSVRQCGRHRRPEASHEHEMSKGVMRVTLNRGKLTVDESGDAANLTLKLPEPLLLEVARGEKNLLTAQMRGDATLEGDPAYLSTLQRILLVSRAPAAAHA